MRRAAKMSLVVGGVALAWACGDDYREAPLEPRDAGADPFARDATTVLEATTVQPALTLGALAPIPRGEAASLSVSVLRGAHPGSLVVAASGLPAGVSAAAVTLEAGTSTASLTVAVASDAPEGAASFDVTVLDGNDKLVTASAVVTVAPARAGTLDPSFGNGGFVDLDVPPTLVAFASDGALYVDRTSGLARWSKDGVRDATYGGLVKLPVHTAWAMAVTDNGQVYFAGYESALGASSPVVLRTTTTGAAYDPGWGASGVSIVKTQAGARFATAIALTVLPTSVYAVTKIEDDGTGVAGPFTVSRMDSGGGRDETYGAAGYRQLASSPSADARAFFDPIAVDRFLLAAPHVSAGATSLFLLEGASAGPLVLRALAGGAPTAVAFHPAGAYVAREGDAGAGLLRVGDAGADPSFGGAEGVTLGGRVRALSVDAEGRPLAAGCRDGVAVWGRFLPDGGADPTYRAGSTSELTCVLATKTTDKFVYLAGVGGPLGYLRVARLLR